MIYFGRDCNLTLAIAGLKPKVKLLNEKLGGTTIADPYVKGIWSTKSSKMSICIWKLRWSKLLYFNKMREWGMQYPIKCVMCDHSVESLGHLSLNCPYTRRMWDTFIDTTYRILWQIMGYRGIEYSLDWRDYRRDWAVQLFLPMLGTTLDCPISVCVVCLGWMQLVV